MTFGRNFNKNTKNCALKHSYVYFDNYTQPCLHKDEGNGKEGKMRVDERDFYIISSPHRFFR